MGYNERNERMTEEIMSPDTIQKQAPLFIVFDGMDGTGKTTRIPWTEPGRLQFIELQRVRHN